jgi:hypothetical protein
MTTRDTPEATLATVLSKAGFEKFGYPFTPTELAAAILTALDGWELHADYTCVPAQGAAQTISECTAEIARPRTLVGRVWAQAPVGSLPESLIVDIDAVLAPAPSEPKEASDAS